MENTFTESVSFNQVSHNISAPITTFNEQSIERQLPILNQSTVLGNEFISTFDDNRRY